MVNELMKYIEKYLKQVRPNKNFEIVFDEEFESESDFWNAYKGFSAPEPCGPEGTFNRVGVVLKDDEVHFGLNPVSPVGGQLQQCIEALNSIQLPY